MYPTCPPSLKFRDGMAADRAVWLRGPFAFSGTSLRCVRMRHLSCQVHRLCPRRPAMLVLTRAIGARAKRDRKKQMRRFVGRASPCRQSSVFPNHLPHTSFRMASALIGLVARMIPPQTLLAYQTIKHVFQITRDALPVMGDKPVVHSRLQGTPFFRAFQ